MLLQRVRLTGTTVKFGVEDTVIGEAVEEQVPQLEDDLAFYPGEMLLLEDIRDEWVWGRVMDQQQFDPATWANIVQAQQIKDYPAQPVQPPKMAATPFVIAPTASKATILEHVANMAEHPLPLTTTVSKSDLQADMGELHAEMLALIQEMKHSWKPSTPLQQSPPEAASQRREEAVEVGAWEPATVKGGLKACNIGPAEEESNAMPIEPAAEREAVRKEEVGEGTPAAPEHSASRSSGATEEPGVPAANSSAAPEPVPEDVGVELLEVLPNTEVIAAKPEQPGTAATPEPTAAETLEEEFWLLMSELEEELSQSREWFRGAFSATETVARVKVAREARPAPRRAAGEEPQESKYCQAVMERSAEAESSSGDPNDTGEQDSSADAKYSAGDPDGTGEEGNVKERPAPDPPPGVSECPGGGELLLPNPAGGGGRKRPDRAPPDFGVGSRMLLLGGAPCLTPPHKPPDPGVAPLEQLVWGSSDPPDPGEHCCLGRPRPKPPDMGEAWSNESGWEHPPWPPDINRRGGVYTHSTPPAARQRKQRRRSSHQRSCFSGKRPETLGSQRPSPTARPPGGAGPSTSLPGTGTSD